MTTTTANHFGPLPSRPVRRPGRHAHLSGAYASLATLTAVLTWVWGLSALDKLTGNFVGLFPAYVSGAISPSKPAVYDRFLREVVLGAPSFYAWLAIATEVGLALAFAAATAALVVPRPTTVRPVLRLIGAAAVGSALFAINLAVLNGAPLPVHTGSPFQSGVPVEYLLAGISGAAAVGASVLLRRTRYLVIRGR